MSANLVALTGLIYAFVAADQAAKGNTAMLITYAGYAFSNIGLWMAVK